MRCGECGSEHIQLQNAKGRKFGYMKWDSVELTVDCDLWTCQECSNILMASGDSTRLDEALKKSLSSLTYEIEAQKLPCRVQIWKVGPGYQVRYKTWFFWHWITETTRKGRQKVAYFQNVDDAFNAAEEFVQLQVKLREKKSKEMVLVYDSNKV